jgi:hypothetical protein
VPPRPSVPPDTQWQRPQRAAELGCEACCMPVAVAAAGTGLAGRARRSPPAIRPPARIGVVCLRTALFTEVGFYEACNNKVR